MVIAWVSLVALLVHVFVSWLFVYKLQYGVIGTAVTLNFSWWVIVFGLLGYTVCGGCPLSWAGFSIEAFSNLWEFVELSAASGVMLCPENWYYRILILMTGNLKNAKIAVDALSISMTINGWEMMIPLAFFAGTVGCKLASKQTTALKFISIFPVNKVGLVGYQKVGLVISSIFLMFLFSAVTIRIFNQIRIRIRILSDLFMD